MGEKTEKRLRRRVTELRQKSEYLKNRLALAMDKVDKLEKEITELTSEKSEIEVSDE